jgi:hypothetical protein
VRERVDDRCVTLDLCREESVVIPMQLVLAEEVAVIGVFARALTHQVLGALAYLF